MNYLERIVKSSKDVKELSEIYKAVIKTTGEVLNEAVNDMNREMDRYEAANVFRNLGDIHKKELPVIVLPKQDKYTKDIEEIIRKITIRYYIETLRYSLDNREFVCNMLRELNFISDVDEPMSNWPESTYSALNTLYETYPDDLIFISAGKITSSSLDRAKAEAMSKISKIRKWIPILPLLQRKESGDYHITIFCIKKL